jgi:hypothetical protein
MGVDFLGYSYVRSEPIPTKYRSIKKSYALKEAERKYLEDEITKAPAYMRDLILAMTGVSIGTDGNYIMTEYCKISDELSEEFYSTIGSQTDFIGVCWQTNTIWQTTDLTRKTSCGRSYSGYSDFCDFLKDLNNGQFYLPPCTDRAPECGFLTPERCNLCIQGLDRIRHHFVSNAWIPDYVSPKEVLPEDDLHDDSWFFREFYSTLSLGSESGVVLIS